MLKYTSNLHLIAPPHCKTDLIIEQRRVPSAIKADASDGSVAEWMFHRNFLVVTVSQLPRGITGLVNRSWESGQADTVRRKWQEGMAVAYLLNYV